MSVQERRHLRRSAVVLLFARFTIRSPSPAPSPASRPSFAPAASERQRPEAPPEAPTRTTGAQAAESPPDADTPPAADRDDGTAGATPEKSGAAVHDDPLQLIERLGRLREQGLLTDEEFADKKRELLDRLRATRDLMRGVLDPPQRNAEADVPG